MKRVRRVYEEGASVSSPNSIKKSSQIVFFSPISGLSADIKNGDPSIIGKPSMDETVDTDILKSD